MSSSRTLCSRGACHLAQVTRGRGGLINISISARAAFTNSTHNASTSVNSNPNHAHVDTLDNDAAIRDSPNKQSQSEPQLAGSSTSSHPAPPNGSEKSQAKSSRASTASNGTRRASQQRQNLAGKTAGHQRAKWNSAFDDFLESQRDGAHQDHRTTVGSSRVAQTPSLNSQVPSRNSHSQPPRNPRTPRGKGHRNHASSRSSRNPDQRGTPSSSHGQGSAFELFNSVVKKDSDQSTSPAKAQMLLSEQKAAAELKAVLALKHKPVRTRLQFFTKKVFPHLQASRSPLPQHLWNPTNLFLSTVLMDTKHPSDLSSGSSLKVAEMLDSIGKYDLRQRNGLMLNLCDAILYNRKRAGDQSSKACSQLTDELIKMWMATSQMIRPSQRDQDLQWALPTSQDATRLMDDACAKHEAGTARWDLTTGVLASLLNQFPTSHARFTIPSLLMTILILSDQNHVKPGQLALATPLLELAHAALQRCAVDVSYIEQVFSTENIHFVRDKAPGLSKVLQENWAQAEAFIADTTLWRHKSIPQMRKPVTKPTLAQFHRRLRTAHATDNTGVIVSLWRDLRAALQDSPTLAAEMRSEPEFLDFWHFVWCSARRPDMLEETQKLMQEIGLGSTIRTYTAMMHGWKLSRDAEMIDSMWDSLIKSNIKLDAHAWTERISGLIELGQPQRGIELLVQMLSMWKAAVENGTSDNAVQPTIEVVNAAFKPLIKVDRQAAQDVLQWAGQEGINPDILTYNILLRECFRNEHTDDDVQSLLQGMNDAGVEPDAATFTIILEEALGSLSHATAEEQVEAINQITEDIKTAGVQPNLETYGKMLHAVASLSNGSDDAVEAVLGHMRSTGHTQISPHMVLILINRTIDRGQRNPDVIEDILHKHGFKNIQAGDQRLWEHVLRAYATMGDTKRAMTLYDELSRVGRTVVSHFALRDLLVALIDADDINTARRIVSDALSDLQNHGVEERRWKHHFWHQAYRYNLLDWKSAPASLKKEVDEGRFYNEMGR